MPNPNPNPPKRKKRSVHSRNVRGGKQKTTSFDYEEAREELGVPNANFQQIAAESLQTGTNPRPPKIKSPLKAEVKKQLAQKELQNTKLVVAHERMERKVSLLMAQVRDLSKALMDEQKKSRLAMQRLLDDAEAMLAESTQQSIGKEGYEYHGELASGLASFCQMVSVEIANRKHLNMNAAVEYNTNSMANTQQSSELGSRQSN